MLHISIFPTKKLHITFDDSYYYDHFENPAEPVEQHVNQEQPIEPEVDKNMDPNALCPSNANPPHESNETGHSRNSFVPNAESDFGYDSESLDSMNGSSDEDIQSKQSCRDET